ncbi:hypothetical protein C8J57DRAFT_1246241 [Mycena rebaudengoi]|nr:hypothetical protein C8J57DRAFT_1246241 [Mycena rebaudengoi]
MSDPEGSCCKKDKPIAAFRLKRDRTSRNKTCAPCNDRTKQANRDRRSAGKENSSPGNVDEPDQEAFGANLGVLLLKPAKDFIDALAEQGDSLELEARVDITSSLESWHDRADELAHRIWNERSSRFMTHTNILHYAQGIEESFIQDARQRATRPAVGIYQACEARPVNSDMIEEFTELVDGFNFPILLPHLVTWLEFTEL